MRFTIIIRAGGWYERDGRRCYPGHRIFVERRLSHPYDVGPGKFQPYVRWQEFTATITNTSSTQFDVGVNYVIKGPDLRITFDYAHDTASFTPSSDRWVLGLQVQL